MDIIDLPGASGATYRFRRWPDTDYHPPIAGNFVVLAAEGTVQVIGITNDLSAIKLQLPEGLLFTRLNVSRASREAEHGDLAAQHPDAAVLER